MKKRSFQSAHTSRILLAEWMLDTESRKILDGVHGYASEHGLSWDIETLGLYQISTIRLALENQNLDGAIIGFSSKDVFASLAKTAMPVVFMRYDRHLPEMPRKRITDMRLDFGASGRAAAAHFLSRGGYRSFGFVEQTRDPEWSRTRGDSFRAAVACSGKPFFRYSAKDGTYQASVASREELSALTEWLVALPKPAAVFAATDERARDALLACRAADIDVPRSVALLGVNNDEFTCRHVFPNLSSIGLGHEELGRAAAAELHRLMGGEAARKFTWEMPVSTIAARATTATSSPGGPLVESALAWIEDHACEGVTAADVAAALGVSKSLLVLRFRELAGTTIIGAIQERRLREVRRRLTETDDSIEEICTASGYGDSGGLRRLFKRRFGASMRAIRAASKD